MCNICRKRFTRSDLLNRHRRIHPAGSTPAPDSRTRDGADASTTNALPTIAPLIDAQHDNYASHHDSSVRLNVPAEGVQHSSHQVQQQNQDPNAIFMRSILEFSNPLSGTTLPRTIPHLAGPSLPLHPPPFVEDSFNNSAWNESSFMTPGSQASYMGIYDADISWTFDNFNAESSSNHSSELEMGRLATHYLQPRI
jgi:hypothetical protein